MGEKEEEAVVVAFFVVFAPSFFVFETHYTPLYTHAPMQTHVCVERPPRARGKLRAGEKGKETGETGERENRGCFL